MQLGENVECILIRGNGALKVIKIMVRFLNEECHKVMKKEKGIGKWSMVYKQLLKATANKKQ